jgi:RNA polymerase sigma-70 factor (ECF subfamily)
VADPAHEPADQAQLADPFLSDRLRKLVASLPEKKRMLMILRYQEEMAPDEIAEVLGMPVTTVRTQLFRTLEHLRQKASQLLGRTYR